MISKPAGGKPVPATGEAGRKGFSREEVEKESTRGGQVSLAEKLRCRIRYLTDGAVFGRAAFVDQIFATNRAHFGRHRTSGARRMRGGDWGEMRVLRDLQSE